MEYGILTVLCNGSSTKDIHNKGIKKLKKVVDIMNAKWYTTFCWRAETGS